MTPAQWPPAPPEVAYFRDSVGTWFAAEVVRGRRWTDDLLLPPARHLADVRVAILDCPTVPPTETPPCWLTVLPSTATFAPGLAEAARRSWHASPYHRAEGAPAGEYLLAGFQALCPPHPACELTPDARESLVQWMRDRPGSLGLIADYGLEAFNRAVRLYWPTPRAFADAILRERVRDEGGGLMLELESFLIRAAIDPRSVDCADLEVERQAIVARLAPERFFTHARDFDGAAAAGREWVANYDRAYRLHYRNVAEAVEGVLADVSVALSLAGELDALNREGRAVGAEAIPRLASAVDEIRDLPAAPEPGAPTTASVTLGRSPAAFAEARLAAAAVLAAVEVQRRRLATTAAR